MTASDRALFRYLTTWADFSTAEAFAAIKSTHREQACGYPGSGHCGGDSTESIESQMEQDKNRRAA
jgi:hypothetical protein